MKAPERSTPYSVSMGSREDLHLLIVKAHLESRLHRRLKIVPERSGEGQTHDIETDDDLRPSIVAEVKELVPREFLALKNQVSHNRGFDSKELAQRWTIVLMADALDGRLAPTPTFPDDLDSDVTAFWLSQGFEVTSKTDREDKWKLDHSLSPRIPIGVKGIAKDVEPFLVTLEHFGINETRSYTLPTTSTQDHNMAMNALIAIGSRTRGALCKGHTPTRGQTPGIDLVFGYSQVRTGRADVVVERVQMWLDGPMSANLLNSLTNAQADERHAVLWLSTEPEIDTALEIGVAYSPDLPLNIPVDLDVVWIFLKSVAWRYDGSWKAGLVEQPDD